MDDMTKSPTLAAFDTKIFVPAKDYELSKQFYTALGWKLNWEHNGGLAEMELGNNRFYYKTITSSNGHITS